MEKRLFNEILKAVLDFCKIKPKAISEAAPDGVYENTIRAWRSRGLPSRKNFNIFLDALGRILSSNQHAITRCTRQLSVLKATLIPIWDKYNVEVVRWDESRSLVENIKEIVTAAYEESLDVNEFGLAKIKESKAKRVVAFDLDGTLIKGFRYSWTIVYKAIGSTEKEAVKLKADFEYGKISYHEWCKSDLEVLRAGKLTFEKVQQAVKEAGATVTKNLEAAIKKLKDNGCKVAIISGGADSVLYALIPNANELFDEIYINKLIYNEETGILEDIIPTKYDWDENGNGVEGKQAGFKIFCAQNGVRPEDSVFVGNDFNDVSAMAIAGMKINYYSYCEQDPSRGVGRRPDIRKLPPDTIHEPGDDLMRVANRIVDWNFTDSDYTD